MAFFPSGTRKVVPEYLYRDGTELALSAHLPLQPFGDSDLASPFGAFEEGNTYEYCEAADVIKGFGEDYNGTEAFVFAKSPRKARPENQTPTYAKHYLDVGVEDQTSAGLKVIKGLSTGAARGAQVLLCEVMTPPKRLWDAMDIPRHTPTLQVVAKVFDPLYYPTRCRLTANYNDVVYMAEKAFAYEAAAYMELHHHRKDNVVVNDFVPQFLGTFSVTHTNAEGKTRQVHVVLMEYIRGPTMLDITEGRHRPGHGPVQQPPVTEEVSLQVFRKVLHGLTALEHVGVFHEDICPGNILVVTERSPDGQSIILMRVVIVNFEISRIFRYTSHSVAFAQLLKTPLHPVARFDLDGLESFVGRFPHDWLTEAEERELTWALGEEEIDEDDFDEDEDREYIIDEDRRMLEWEKWAYESMTEEDFTMGDESEALACDDAACERLKLKKIEELKRTVATPSSFRRHRKRSASLNLDSGKRQKIDNGKETTPEPQKSQFIS
ncbi:hypothetical protein F5X68DRAFT_246756 [Plectosphaerella plurivora]|uniref:EKC/KEOPS complex subunit BUD32 n=1 Tax=Plectosphaerella plurivora TaxID=936078 RepID=A0A9P8V4G6_9PEZI|nr:hypothetical protein F5X68DRAFT_246756 [Plectosphaerella plurivora]